MADTRTLTVRVSAGDLERLNALAQITSRSVSELVSEAVAAHLAEQEWQIAAIREAVEEVDAGAVPIPHDKVVEWLRSWGTSSEVPPPR